MLTKRFLSCPEVHHATASSSAYSYSLSSPNNPRAAHASRVYDTVYCTYIFETCRTFCYIKKYAKVVPFARRWVHKPFLLWVMYPVTTIHAYINPCLILDYPLLALTYFTDAYPYHTYPVNAYFYTTHLVG